MLEDFIIARIKAELPFEPNEEKEGLFHALGAFIVSRDPRKAFILRGYAGTGKYIAFRAGNADKDML